MKLDISVRLTPRVITIICPPHGKNIIKIKKERKNTNKYGGTRPKLIY